MLALGFELWAVALLPLLLANDSKMLRTVHPLLNVHTASGFLNGQTTA